MNGWSPYATLRVAIAKGRGAEIVDAVRQLASISDTGCWLWQGRLNESGYPRIASKNSEHGSYYRVHRVVAEAAHGPLAGRVVHHVCAIRHCVNPLHLRPVSAAENVAEMIQRSYYIDRIARLEAALAEWAPLHPLLDSANSPSDEIPSEN